jgi:hypothetical protein
VVTSKRASSDRVTEAIPSITSNPSTKPNLDNLDAAGSIFTAVKGRGPCLAETRVSGAPAALPRPAERRTVETSRHDATQSSLERTQQHSSTATTAASTAKQTFRADLCASSPPASPDARLPRALAAGRSAGRHGQRAHAWLRTPDTLARHRPRRRSWSEAATMSRPTPLSNASAPGQQGSRDRGRLSAASGACYPREGGPWGSSWRCSSVTQKMA